MTTYKQGEEWKKTLHENTFLKMRIQELEDENEALRIEIIEMRNTADKEDEILDEYFGDEEILDEKPITIFEETKCSWCQGAMVFDLGKLYSVHMDTLQLTCDKTPSVGHDPSGSEY